MEQIKLKNSRYETISMMHLRKNIGAVVNDVVYKKKMYLIERRGKPLCVLGSYSNDSDSSSNLKPSHNVSAERLFGCLKGAASTVEEWTGDFNKAEQDYQSRIENLWGTKK